MAVLGNKGILRERKGRQGRMDWRECEGSGREGLNWREALRSGAVAETTSSRQPSVGNRRKIIPRLPGEMVPVISYWVLFGWFLFSF